MNKEICEKCENFLMIRNLIGEHYACELWREGDKNSILIYKSLIQIKRQEIPDGCPYRLEHTVA
jgi:hypothetical protein